MGAVRALLKVKEREKDESTSCHNSESEGFVGITVAG